MTLTRLPADLPDRLRAAGLKVVVIDGWQTRSRPASTGRLGAVGVLNHHTGSVDRLGDLADDRKYALWLAITGRPDLPAPLVHLSLSLEGTVYVLAAGRCNHAGTAKPSGSVAGGDGNELYVGIEWMLSGTQPIPPKMYEAGAVLNAVLLDVLGSSVQAVSCHYQTSVTGKWDIGDPHGIAFNGRRVLNVAKFRDEVQHQRELLHPPEIRTTERLTLQFSPLQFSDNRDQKERDVEKIFSRGKHLMAGTESADRPMPTLLADAAHAYGYVLHRVHSTWVAALKAPIVGKSVEIGYEPVLKAGEGPGEHGPRVLTWMSFETERLGRISVGAGHYLRDGAKPGQPNHERNLRYAEAIGDWARDKGRGSGVVFYMGDQNIVDRHGDTFFGQPLTSAWDEVGHWQNSGHGNIDVIASYDRDGRVVAEDIRALGDKVIPLATDHSLVEAEYRVRRLR